MKNLRTRNNCRFFLGHHKCATQYIRRICLRICTEAGMTTQILNNMKDPFEAYSQSQVDFYMILNAKFKFQDPAFCDFLAFHVVRDPRDIIVSAYYSHLHSHPTTQWVALRQQRKLLHSINMDEGLISTMRFLTPTLNDLKRWQLGHPSILELRFEDLIADPQSFFKNAFLHLDMVDNAKKSILIHELVARDNFQRLSKGRKQGEEDVHSHYRKGISGDWKNHFTARHKDFFKEHFQEILEKFNYESDDNW